MDLMNTAENKRGVRKAFEETLLGEPHSELARVLSSATETSQSQVEVEEHTEICQYGCGETWTKKTRAWRIHHSEASPCFYRRKKLLAPLFEAPTETNLNGKTSRRLFGTYNNGAVVLLENGTALAVPSLEELPESWWKSAIRASKKLQLEMVNRDSS